MGNNSQLDEIDEQIALAFSNAKEKENLERERATYARQVEKIHELNTNLDEVAKKVSSLEVRVSRLKASMANLFTVGLSEEGKEMVRDQLNDIFGEKIVQMRKEADEEVKRVRKEGKRVSAPISVVSVIGVTLLVLLAAFGGLIVANADLFHSEWLNKYIWTMIGIWAGGVGVTVLAAYLFRNYPN